MTAGCVHGISHQADRGVDLGMCVFFLLSGYLGHVDADLTSSYLLRALSRYD
jgi:hypothetical protein